MPDSTLQLGSAPAADAPNPPAPPSAAPAGTLIDGRYRVERVIGVGGMGTVYEAENVRIGRRVALKVLRPEMTLSPVDVDRFEREARIAVRLSSPHVVDVLDFGRTAAGELYIVMELLQGESVASRLARVGRLAPERVAELMRQLLAGLGAAHDAGVVHRDLKPDNLWLVPAEEGERLKILDFGIAKVADLPEGAARTQAGLVIGTPQYLSPEQAVGGELDGRSDLYSAGIIAWVLLTGRHPFPRSDLRELVRAHAFDPVPPPDREHPELASHPALLRLVARATEKKVAQRAQSCAELLAVLDGRDAKVRWTPPRAAPAGADAPGRAPVQARTVSGLLRPTATLPRAVGTTVLVTEIVGYPELERGLAPDELARLLLAHDDVVMPAVRVFQGRRVRSLRETVLAVFPSPTNAVLCGMAIQDRLLEHAPAARGSPLALRVGIHLGEARSDGGDLAGDAVDVALAIRSTAAAGDVALSRTVYLAMNLSEVHVEARRAIAHPTRDEPLPTYRVERAEGPAPYGGREAARVARGERITRVLGPVAEGIASIEDGAAEGRTRATLRVAGAATGLVALRCVDVGARAASAATALVCWIGWRGRPPPPALERVAARVDALRGWVRLRRPVQRAALTRQLH